MPAVDDAGRRIAPPRTRPTAPRTVRITTPDQQDRARAAQRPPTPDQQDRNRSPVRRQRDAAVSDRNVREARLRYIRRARREMPTIGRVFYQDPIRYNAPTKPFNIREAQAKARQQRAERLAPALTILENLNRPVHAIAAGTRAGIRGDDVIAAAGRGLTLKDKSLFSDVLGDLGVKGPLKSVGGFGLDVLADPTTYASFGAASVGRKVAEKEARKATQKALKSGASKKAADRAGRAAAARVLKTETNRGLTVGFAGKTTSGRTTAKVARGLRVPQASERVRGSLPGRLARHVAPSVRPAGVSERDFLKVRAAIVRGRAIAWTGERAVRNRAQAVARLLPGGRHEKITDALESRSLVGLSPEEAKVARALAHDYDAMHRAEHARGLVGPKFKEFGYSPRRAVSELEPTGSRRRLGGAQLESSKARTNRKPYREFRGTEDDIYTENAALAYYLRGRDSAVKLGRKEVIDALHDVGRRWHPGAALKDGEEIYKFGPRKMPARVEGDELKSLMRGGAPPGLNEYRVLHRDLVRTAEQGIPERLEGLEELGRIWDRQIQGRVKTLLTVVNPQYHLTNLYGDLFNAYKAAPVTSVGRNLGISVEALAYRARREAAAKTLSKQVDPSSHGVKIGGRKMTLDQLLKEAEHHGAINQGFIGRDLAEVLDRQGKEAAQAMGQGRVARHTRVGRRIATSRVGSKVAHPIDTIRGASQYREDAVRLALYLTRRRQGDTPDEAARFTNRHLLDYGDLTQFEKSVLRRVLPFYTWTARNTPQQIRALIERPGKYANLEKVREETQKASALPEGYEGDLEKYEQQGVPIPVPGTSNLLYPKLPVTDLGRLTIKDQGNYLMAMLTPVIKTPVELDQNYSFFLRHKIDELVGEKGPEGQTVEQLKPAPPVLLTAIRRMPGPLRREFTEALHLQPYVDKRTKKRVVGWPARVDYVWRSTPATTFAGQAGQQIPNTRGQSPGQATFGYLTGLKVVPYKPPEVAKKRAGELYGYLQAKAKSMRDRGTAYDASGNRRPEYQKVLDQAREAYAIIDPKPKPPSLLSPEAQKALENVRQSVSASGGGLSADAQRALENLRKP